MSESLLVETVYGSRLFGTALATSDVDLKRVFLTDMRGLVFNNISTRNTTDIRQGVKFETEEHHVSALCRMIKQGQTLTASLLFTPESMVTHTTPAWNELVANRHRLISKNLGPYVGYARSQASKYALKGERLRTLEDFVIELKRVLEAEDDIGHRINVDKEGRLHTKQFDILQRNFGNRPGVRLWTETTANQDIHHIEVCGKSFGETTPVKLWLGPLQAMLKQYGRRAQQAREDNGQDLKAMYHSVRLCGEMNEILRTGHLTYPRPEAPLLLDIRNGKLTNEEVGVLIDQAVAEGDRLMAISTLRDKPDGEWLDDWMLRTQGGYAAADYVQTYPG